MAMDMYIGLTPWAYRLPGSLADESQINMAKPMKTSVKGRFLSAVGRRGGDSGIECTDMPCIVPNESCLRSQVGRWLQAETGYRFRIVLGENIFHLIAYARFAVIVLDFELQNHLQQRFTVKLIDENWRSGNKHLREEDGEK